MRLDVAVANAEKDQTLNTPAIATLFIMASQIEWMNKQGDMTHWAAATRSKADLVYGWAETWDKSCPFVADPALRSPTVATVDLVDEVDAGALCKCLRAHGVLDVEAYRKLGRNQVRIALFPNVEEDNLRRLMKCVEYVVDHMAS
jgi:phosphoserine aminotransferase